MRFNILSKVIKVIHSRDAARYHLEKKTCMVKILKKKPDAQ
jgi:hypothetical protein